MKKGSCIYNVKKVILLKYLIDQNGKSIILFVITYQESKLKSKHYLTLLCEIKIEFCCICYL